jgi:hypothetical protein
LAQADDFESEDIRTRAEMKVLARALEAEDVTVPELAAIIRRSEELLKDCVERQIRAERNLGIVLNWADENGHGELFRILLKHPELGPDFERRCTDRIAELEATS